MIKCQLANCDSDAIYCNVSYSTYFTAMNKETSTFDSYTKKPIPIEPLDVQTWDSFLTAINELRFTFDVKLVGDYLKVRSFEFWNEGTVYFLEDVYLLSIVSGQQDFYSSIYLCVPDMCGVTCILTHFLNYLKEKVFCCDIVCSNILSAEHRFGSKLLEEIRRVARIHLGQNLW